MCSLCFAVVLIESLLSNLDVHSLLKYTHIVENMPDWEWFKYPSIFIVIKGSMREVDKLSVWNDEVHRKLTNEVKKMIRNMFYIFNACIAQRLNE